MGFAKLPENRVRDYYFSLWKLTDAGRQDPAAVQRTIDTASAMIRNLGAQCSLYVAVGGAYDFIGVAYGATLDDAKIVAVQKAIQAFGTLQTTFIKTQEMSLAEFGAFTTEIQRLHGLSP